MPKLHSFTSLLLLLSLSLLFFTCHTLANVQQTHNNNNNNAAKNSPFAMDMNDFFTSGNSNNISTILTSQQICSTNSASHIKAHKRTATQFLQVMNGCHMDTSSNEILYRTSKLLIDWFSPTVITSVIFVFIMVLPWIMSVYDDEQKTTENMSRFAHYTLVACDLMFRISWVTAFGAWLLAVFRQASPCSCSQHIYASPASSSSSLFLASSNEMILLGQTAEKVVGYVFGMPNVHVLVTTVLSLHAIQRMSIPIGGFLLLVMPVAAVFSGMASTGQVIAAFFIAIPLHFYQTLTPQWLRLVDFAFNLFSGVLVLPLVKHFYLSQDFAFSEMFFEGVIMQVFSLVVVIVFFSLGFLKITIKRPIYESSPLDIQHLRMRLTPEQKQLMEGEQMGYDHSDYANTSSPSSSLLSSSSRRGSMSLASAGYSYDEGHVFSVLYAYPMILYAIALGTFLLVAAFKVAAVKYLDEMLSFGQSIHHK